MNQSNTYITLKYILCVDLKESSQNKSETRALLILLALCNKNSIYLQNHIFILIQ